MDDNQLTYTRETIVQQLKERLAAQQKERQDRLDAQQVKNRAVIDQIVEVATKYPSFLVWLSGKLEDWGDARPGTAAFAEMADRKYATGVERYGGDPDEDLNRLIRVYENATDDTVKLSVSDDVWRYL